MRTGDLVPRLAWGVGRRNASQRRLPMWCIQAETFNYIQGYGHFSSFAIKYFMTKLEKNQPDTVCPPWLGAAGD